MTQATLDDLLSDLTPTVTDVEADVNDPVMDLHLTAEAEDPDLMGLLPIGMQRVIGGAFKMMEIAEDEIQEAMDRTPGHRAEINNAFLALRPPASGVFQGERRHAYRGHVKELLSRIERDGADANLGRGTCAEACVAFSRMSQAAPLKHEAFTAYMICFIDAFGERTASKVVGSDFVRRANEDRDSHLVREHIDRVKDKLTDHQRQQDWEASIS